MMTPVIDHSPGAHSHSGTPAVAGEERSILIEQICDSSTEAGECYFCTGPETD
jgi:hypothetical protein